MMKQFERYLMDPIAIATDKPTAASCAIRPSIYRAERDQKQKTDVLNVWEGEGGKSASVHNAKGFGVFVDARFTF